MYYFSWQMALFLTILLPIVILSTRLYVYKLKASDKNYRQANSEMIDMVRVTSSHFEIIEINNLKSYWAERLKTIIDKVSITATENFRLKSIISRLSYFNSYIVVALVALIGDFLVRSHVVTIGTVISYFFWMTIINSALSGLFVCVR